MCEESLENRFDLLFYTLFSCLYCILFSAVLYLKKTFFYFQFRAS